MEAHKLRLREDVEALQHEKDIILQDIEITKVEMSDICEGIAAIQAGIQPNPTATVEAQSILELEKELADTLATLEEEHKARAGETGRLRLQIETQATTIQAYRSMLDAAAKGSPPSHDKQPANSSKETGSKARTNEIDQLRRDLKAWEDKSETQRAQLHKIQTAQARYADERGKSAAIIARLGAQVAKLTKDKEESGLAEEKKGLERVIRELEGKVEGLRAERRAAGKLILELTVQLESARAGQVGIPAAGYGAASPR